MSLRVFALSVLLSTIVSFLTICIASIALDNVNRRITRRNRKKLK